MTMPEIQGTNLGSASSFVGLRIFGGCTDEPRHALTLTISLRRGNLRADRAPICSFSQREKAGMREDRPTFPQECVDPAP